MWIDATVAASGVAHPGSSEVVDSTGFALAPGNNSGKNTLTYLIFQRVLESQNVGIGSVGRVFSMILANIVAFFLMHLVGKHLTMAHFATVQHKILNTTFAWAIGLLITVSILRTILTSIKTEAQAITSPPSFKVSTGHSRQRHLSGTIGLYAAPLEIGNRRLRLHGS